MNREVDMDGNLAYAEYCGMDALDEDLLWIAKEGYYAEVPERWVEQEADNGQAVYYNTETDESSWNHPLDGC
jgi:hypothetical protein